MNLHEVPRATNIGRRIATLDCDFTRDLGMGAGAFGVCIEERIIEDPNMGQSFWTIRMENNFYSDEDGNPDPNQPREEQFYVGEFVWL